METGHVYISRDVIFDEAVFPFSNPSSNFDEQPGANCFNLNTNHLQNLLPINSVHAAPSNAENPAIMETAPSSECVPCAPSLGAGQQIPVPAPSSGSADVLLPLPDSVLPGASQPLPAAVHVGGMAPSIADPATTEHLAPVDSSPTASGTDSDDNFAGPVVPPIAADAQQINLVHQYGTRLWNNIRQPKTRTDGTVTYSVSRVSSLTPSSHVTAIEHPL